MENFEESSPNPLDTYFSRAEFDERKKVFKPEYNKWATTCICKKPTNPLQLYIQCEACDIWFHPECEKVSPEIENFVCASCKAQ